MTVFIFFTLSVLEVAAAGTAMVHMADGSTLPLQGWALSYEVAAQGQDGTPLPPARRDTNELWAGGRRYPLDGRTLEIEYEERSRPVEVDGKMTLGKVPVPRRLVVVEGAERRNLKIEPPARGLLAPDGGRASARSLELVGQTLGGTRRELCLLSFTPDVVCAPEAADRVVKIEFQP